LFKLSHYLRFGASRDASGIWCYFYA